MLRILALLTGLTLLSACATASLNEPVEDLGQFKLGHNIVVAPKMQKGPVSRDATREEWIAALTAANAARFGRYRGDRLYHFGISVEGFMLAPGGVPLVYTPKSALILNVTVWDDAAGRKLNDKPHQITVFEDTEAGTLIIGSGHARTREQQLNGLAFNAARQIEVWMAQQRADFGWFTDQQVFNPPEREAPRPSN